MARVLSALAPVEIDTFEIATWRIGVPLTTVTLPRTEIDRLARWESSPAELWHAAVLTPSSPSPPAFVDGGYPRFGWNIYPVLEQRYFDPDNPVYLGVGVGARHFARTVPRAVARRQRHRQPLRQFQRHPTQQRQRAAARSIGSARYLVDGRYGMTDLMLTYRFKLSPEVYARVSGGYLEDMFAGVGGEILYRPFGQRWAIGGDLFAVQQRDFNRLFGLRNYRTVTGHVSLYYQLPWHGLEARVHIGRYLAGDYGGTFELVRRFESGVEIGGWFTLTNVSPARFGEGSFDKGIRITLPLEWIVPFGTQSTYTLDLRPTQRDGGQRLAGDDTLYDMIDPSDYGAMMSQWHSVFSQ